VLDQPVIRESNAHARGVGHEEALGAGLGFGLLEAGPRRLLVELMRVAEHAAVGRDPDRVLLFLERLKKRACQNTDGT